MGITMRTILVVCVLGGPVFAETRPQMWLGPNYVYFHEHDYSDPVTWGNHLTEPQRLSSLINGYDVFELLSWQVLANPNNFLPPVLSTLRANGVKLAVQDPIFSPVKLKSDNTTGPKIDCSKDPEDPDGKMKEDIFEISAAITRKYLQSVEAAGSRVDFIYAEDPLARLVKGSHKEKRNPSCAVYDTYDEALPHLITALKAIHAEFPHVRFGLGFNFVHYYYGPTDEAFKVATGRNATVDLKAFYPRMINRLRKSGIDYIDYVTIDIPYEFTKPMETPKPIPNPHPEFIGQFAAQVRATGLKFGVYFNSSYGNLHKDESATTVDKKAQKNTLAYIRQLYANGVSPDIMNLTAWTRFPQSLYPSITRHTYANTAKKALAIINKRFPSNLAGSQESGGETFDEYVVDEAGGCSSGSVDTGCGGL